MKRIALAGLFLLAACGNKTTTQRSDAAVMDASTDAAVVPPFAFPYGFTKYVDWLHRYSAEVPEGFTKLETRACTDEGCTGGTTFNKGDLTISFMGDPRERAMTLSGQLGAIKHAGATEIEQEKRVENGWRVAGVTSVNAQHYVIIQKRSFNDAITLQVIGPVAKKPEIDALAARIDTSFQAESTKPADYCAPIAWDGGVAPSQTFTGKLAIGQGIDATTIKDDKPFVLQIDKPICDATGRATWELQAVTKGPDLKPFTDKPAVVTGELAPPKPPHEHRAVVVHVSKIAAP